MYLDLEFRLPSGSRPPFCSKRIITWCSRTSHPTSLLGISPTPQTINTTQVITYPSGQSYSYIGARCSVMPRYVLVPLVASSFEGFRPSGACRDLPGLHRRTCINLQEQNYNRQTLLLCGGDSFFTGLITSAETSSSFVLGRHYVRGGITGCRTVSP